MKHNDPAMMEKKFINFNESYMVSGPFSYFSLEAVEVFAGWPEIASDDVMFFIFDAENKPCAGDTFKIGLVAQSGKILSNFDKVECIFSFFEFNDFAFVRLFDQLI